MRILKDYAYVLVLLLVIITPIAFILVANFVSILVSFLINAVVLVTIAAIMITAYDINHK